MTPKRFYELAKNQSTVTNAETQDGTEIFMALYGDRRYQLSYTRNARDEHMIITAPVDTRPYDPDDLPGNIHRVEHFMSRETHGDVLPHTIDHQDVMSSVDRMLFKDIATIVGTATLEIYQKKEPEKSLAIIDSEVGKIILPHFTHVKKIEADHLDIPPYVQAYVQGLPLSA